MTRFLIEKLIFLVCLLSLAHSCGDKEETPAIGDKLSTPVSLASDSSGSYFYVLNSDFLHKYKTGSILILDNNGQRVTAEEVPQLGKVLNVRGNDLLVAFDHESGSKSSKAIHFDITDPKKLVKQREWAIDDCTPANIVSRVGYDYFALTCQDGDLYLGTFDKGVLKHVRKYPQVRNTNRRAMYLDSKRDLLFLFTTDTHDGSTTLDSADTDKETWVNGTKKSDQADEIPDLLQISDQRVDIDNNGSRFHFMVYDIKAEKAAGFPDREWKDVRATEARWMHFKLKNFDGSPDNATVQGDPSLKFYRTNFWEAQPDPEDPDSFYLSHRGLGTINHSEHANDLIKVRFLPGGSPRSTGSIPPLDSYMSFERVYGFKGTQTGKDKYFNSFKIVNFSGRKVVLLNSFRDLSSFSNQTYGLAAANVVYDSEPVDWYSPAVSTESKDSYWDLALGKDGKVLTMAFFSETLRLFTVKYGETITLNKSIE